MNPRAKFLVIKVWIKEWISFSWTPLLGGVSFKSEPTYCTLYWCMAKKCCHDYRNTLQLGVTICWKVRVKCQGYPTWLASRRSQTAVNRQVWKHSLSLCFSVPLNLKLIFARRKVKNSWPSGREIFNQWVNSQKRGFPWIPGGDSGSGKGTVNILLQSGTARPEHFDQFSTFTVHLPTPELSGFTTPHPAEGSRLHHSHGPSPSPPTPRLKRASREWQWNETAVRTDGTVEDGVVLQRVTLAERCGRTRINK